MDELGTILFYKVPKMCKNPELQSLIRVRRDGFTVQNVVDMLQNLAAWTAEGNISTDNAMKAYPWLGRPFQRVFDNDDLIYGPPSKEILHLTKG